MTRPRPSSEPRAGLFVTIDGPSGVGKGSVKALIQEYYPWVWLSVSCTTRKPRPGEVDGADYHFVSTEQFESMIAAGEFLEWASYAGNLYGTPRGPVDRQLHAGLPALLEIELQGARQVRRAMPEAQLVFLAPPSWEELVRRLTGRGTEDAATIDRRLVAARCILPVSQNPEVPAALGLRHRAALGLTEATDAVVLVVSEETGQMSLVRHGEIHRGLAAPEIKARLQEWLLAGPPAKQPAGARP